MIKKFIENNQWESLGFFSGLNENTRLAHLSYDMFLSGKKDSESRIKDIHNKKEEELFNTGKSELLIDDIRKMNPVILGINVNPGLFFKKQIGEIVHYSRIVFDMYNQLINACIYLGRDHESVNNRTIKNKYDKEKETEVEKYWLSLIESEQYKYIKHLDNYLKHIHVAPIKTAFTNEIGYTVTIESFSHGGRHFEEKDALCAAKDIIDFVDNSNKEFFEKLLKSMVPIKNRASDVRKLLYRKKDGRIYYIAFFIDIDSDKLDVKQEFGCETIEIHPIILHNGRIYEDDIFRCEKVFIRRKNTKDTVIGVAIQEKGKKKTKYKKYRVKSCGEEEYEKYKANYVNNTPNIRFENAAHYGVEYKVK